MASAASPRWAPAPAGSVILSEAQPPALIPHRIATSWSAIEPLVMGALEAADPARSIVVFDIDATVLFGDDRRRAGARVNEEVRPVYDRAVARGIGVYFITARGASPENEEETKRQLSALDFAAYQELMMLPEGVDEWPDISLFKARARALCVQRSGGKRIVLCVGDQPTDHAWIKSRRLIKEVSRIHKANYWFISSPDPEGHTRWCVKLDGTNP